MVLGRDESTWQKASYSRSIAVFMAWLLAFGLCSAVPAQYGGGTGDPNDPYLIYTAEQMNAIGATPNDWDKHFQLRADIDLSAYQGTSFNRIGFNDTTHVPPDWLPPFSGVFDGNHHTISSFTYIVDAREPLPSRNWWGDEYVGLFGYVRGPQALIKNVGLVDPNIAPASTCSERVVQVGALVGQVKEGTVENCYVEGGSVVADRHIGGLVGSNTGRIARCHTSCAVKMAPDRPLRAIEAEYAFLAELGYTFGGLVGSNSGEISHCHSSAYVQGRQCIGGLIGNNNAQDPDTGVITESYATGVVSGDKDIGGLVGWNTGTIRHCRAAGAVLGGDTAGGLVGYSASLFQTATIESSHATGEILGDTYLGGLAGGNDGIIQNSFATGQVSGVDVVGGLTGFNYDTVQACYATGTVTGNGQSAGGLSGTNPGAISCCYAHGSIMGAWGVGGLVGFSSGAVRDSYATGQVTGETHVGGLVGTGSGMVTASFWDKESSDCQISAGGTGKSTMEMMYPETYTAAGWDFTEEGENGIDDVWKMCCGRPAYPTLAWQQTIAGDFVDPAGVDWRDLAFLSQNWLVSTGLPCYGADLTFDGNVDLHDLVLFGTCWRQGLDEMTADDPLAAGR